MTDLSTKEQRATSNEQRGMELDQPQPLVSLPGRSNPLFDNANEYLVMQDLPRDDVSLSDGEIEEGASLLRSSSPHGNSARDSGVPRSSIPSEARWALLLLAVGVACFVLGYVASEASLFHADLDKENAALQTGPARGEPKPAPPPKSLENPTTKQADNLDVSPSQSPSKKPTWKPTSVPTPLSPSTNSVLEIADASDSPTISASSSQPTEAFSPEDPLFVPHLPYGENEIQYRRVCAPLHSSILCLTLRFPFPVTPQDTAYSYPRPVDDRFYELDRDAHFLEQDDLQNCMNTTKMLSTDKAVKTCLDDFAVTFSDPTVVSVWTRRRLVEDEFSLYGAFQSQQQGKRIDQFFDKHLILVIGASPAPDVLKCMQPLFGKCKYGGMKPGSQFCYGHDTRRELGNTQTFQSIPLNTTYLHTLGYFPTDWGHGRKHFLQTFNLVEKLQSGSFALGEPPFDELRKLTLIVEYPIAHCQNQNMMLEEWENVKTVQDGYPKQILQAQSKEGRKMLADMGYDLQHIIAFDGIPQFNPSKTGGYDWAQKSSTTLEQFMKNKGYPGWIPEYGSTCRGPLPPTSKLAAVNRLSRESFQENGLDMRFYGRTWEFANQFWWHTRQWTKRHGLDCTHSGASSGMSCVHRYLLMAMVDDHFDDLEEQRA